MEALVSDRLQRLLEVGPDRIWIVGARQDLRVQVRLAEVHITLKPAGSVARASELDRLRSRLPATDHLERDGADPTSLRLTIAVRPVFRGGRSWLVTSTGAAAIRSRHADPALVKALRSAHAWQTKLGASPLTPVQAITDPHSAPDSYVRKLIRLTFLAPDIQRAILAGEHPTGLTLQQVMDRPIPISWSEQRRQLGFARL